MIDAEGTQSTPIEEAPALGFVEGLGIGAGLGAMFTGALVDIEPPALRLAMVVGGTILTLSMSLLPSIRQEFKK